VSPQRIDYYDSPEAPKANSLVPSVSVVVVNDAGEILLIRRTDNGNRAGGAIDLGESVAQAAIRETLEESGIECAITGIVGIYSDPKHVILYTSNGEVRQEFSIVLTARPLLLGPAEQPRRVLGRVDDQAIGIAHDLLGQLVRDSEGNRVVPDQRYEIPLDAAASSPARAIACRSSAIASADSSLAL